MAESFGINFRYKHDIEHLIITICDKYNIAIYRICSGYCSLIIEWYYTNIYVDISILGYITKTLIKLQHSLLNLPQHTPYKWSTPSYGTKVQYTLHPHTHTHTLHTTPHNITHNKRDISRIHSINNTIIKTLDQLNPIYSHQLIK